MFVIRSLKQKEIKTNLFSEIQRQNVINCCLIEWSASLTFQHVRPSVAGDAVLQHAGLDVNSRDSKGRSLAQHLGRHSPFPCGWEPLINVLRFVKVRVGDSWNIKTLLDIAVMTETDLRGGRGRY